MSDTPVTDGSPEEFADLEKIKVEDGVEYMPLSLMNQRWIERNYDSPTTIYDEPVPWRFWKLVADHIKRQARATGLGLDALRHKREVAVAYCRALVKNRVNAMTPFRAQLDLHDMLVVASPTATPDEEVLRCFREAVYVCFNNEYLARGIG